MNFTLRPWKMDDLESLVRFANNPLIANNMTDRFPHPYTEATGKAFIEMAMSHSPLHIFAIDIDGTASGGIGIHPQEDVYRKNAELGYWIAQPYWGKGIVTNAVKQMLDYGFSNFEINRIFARPYGTNLASQRVLEKAGFRLEARFEKTILKNGEWKDELVYAVRR